MTYWVTDGAGNQFHVEADELVVQTSGFVEFVNLTNYGPNVFVEGYFYPRRVYKLKPGETLEIENNAGSIRSGTEDAGGKEVSGSGLVKPKISRIRNRKIVE